MGQQSAKLIIACGALAREIQQLIDINSWTDVDVQCLPANLHNRPDQIPDRVLDKVQSNRDRYAHIFVAYADCGTGGLLDSALEALGVERLEGAHCYQFYAGSEVFEQLHDAEPGTFYLTDFLVRHFDRLIIDELGLDRHPELRETFFRNYSRLLYLSQAETPELVTKARRAADRLGLKFEHRPTGFGQLETGLNRFMVSVPLTETTPDG
ncbi:MAG TPA: DUF1638 domain-containing protein [Gammaproteobacteria bacterium]|nr:DUF1638 domain-containing protein [Gammaproteobacteria bacterium]PHS09884.1 MAG: hypothetical protein COA89_01095 [Acidithiobacillus sp.]RTZ62244.1 MAG: hypothetical protein DSZ34_12065 [Gammaproteobacteria bacterium]HAD35366.1 hypothetical protein [Gammaproteobacteria bacterium]HBK75691.1 hypothetical protein [Gammaproteobacteria bacterium]